MTPIARYTLNAAALLSIAFFGLMLWSGNTCALDLGDGDRLMRAELRRSGLDARFLSPGVFSADECTVSYTYQGASKHIEYTVLDDPTRGPKLTRWDHARDASDD